VSGLRFECTRCGRCCTARDGFAHVYLNQEEVAALARELRLTLREFSRRYTFRDEYGWTQLVPGEGRCIFLEPHGGTCRVYAARPAQCRSFPFWPRLVEDGQWTEPARALCEGVDRGRLYSAEEVEARMRELIEAEEDQ
jgi:Fe-S-cluster containining protein